ncbi:MAG TPA: hypothetical protein VHB98_09030 [Chloroflexota bacterium]|jgi:hypothetical protein|nr:hypothetical protein [Chloroflexota bacterium]
MATEQQPIDITNMPDLVRLAEEVRASNHARVLQRDHEDLAILVPVAKLPTQRLPARKNPKIAREAIEASAGGWKGLIDAEQLKKDIKEARGSDRAFPSL